MGTSAPLMNRTRIRRDGAKPEVSATALARLRFSLQTRTIEFRHTCLIERDVCKSVRISIEFPADMLDREVAELPRHL